MSVSAGVTADTERGPMRTSYSAPWFAITSISGAKFAAVRQSAHCSWHDEPSQCGNARRSFASTATPDGAMPSHLGHWRGQEQVFLLRHRRCRTIPSRRTNLLSWKEQGKAIVHQWRL